MVAATAKRNEKVAILAALLKRAHEDGSTQVEIEAIVAVLCGAPRQGRIGVGWAAAAALGSGTAAHSTIHIAELDAMFESRAAAAGPGSQAARHAVLDGVVSRATPIEATLIRRLLIGDLRHGALEGVVAAAIAAAAAVPLERVRRAAMLSGSLSVAALAALAGGAAALEAFALEPLRAIQPMLASTSPSASAAINELGLCSVGWKLDGARVQAHRRGNDVLLFSRNLNDMTSRLPGVVAAVRALPCDAVVLDGEVLGVGEDDRPDRFQDTMALLDLDAATNGAGTQRRLSARWFDCLHLDGIDLLDAPLADRLAALGALTAAAGTQVPSIVTADPAVAEDFAATALAAGHEGVMVKAISSLYEAGRRGGSWRKVKPVKTLDLVVLAAEWGSGRRQGWLSNIHMGALDPATGGFVMVGKTFKGMTDVMLTWQTAQLLAREVEAAQSGPRHVVVVRPELVVEVALDGVVRSTRYPGGVALRFARVRRYRDDKDPGDVDTIDAVRFLGGL